MRLRGLIVGVAVLAIGGAVLAGLYAIRTLADRVVARLGVAHLPPGSLLRIVDAAGAAAFTLCFVEFTRRDLR